MNNASLYAPVYDTTIQMVSVAFRNSNDCESAWYTYKSFIPLKVNDTVVCEARGFYSVATVKKVDIEIPILDEKEFRWVVGVLDLDRIKHVLEWEDTLKTQIAEKRVSLMRNQMIENIGVSRADLQSLLIAGVEGGEENDG